MARTTCVECGETIDGRGVTVAGRGRMHRECAGATGEVGDYSDDHHYHDEERLNGFDNFRRSSED